MKRRDAMKKVAAIMGASLSVPTLLVFQQGCSTDLKPKTTEFSVEETEVLQKIGNIIIPESDIPGAATVGTGAFTVMILESCYPMEAREEVHKFVSELSPDFKDKPIQDQIKKVQQIDDIIYGEANEQEKEKWNAYRIVKELALLGYFTSEPGTTQALEYVQVPGRYEGCIEVTPGQKAWA